MGVGDGGRREKVRERGEVRRSLCVCVYACESVCMREPGRWRKKREGSRERQRLLSVCVCGGGGPGLVACLCVCVVELGPWVTHHLSSNLIYLTNNK